MPKHRMCKSGGWHFAIGVAAALSVVAVLEPVVYSAQPAQAQSGAKKGKPAQAQSDGSKSKPAQAKPAQAKPAQAQGGGIRNIRVEGNRRVEP
jgi:hypothetical protein